MTETTNNNRHSARDIYSNRRRVLDRINNDRAAEGVTEPPSATALNEVLNQQTLADMWSTAAATALSSTAAATIRAEEDSNFIANATTRNIFGDFEGDAMNTLFNFGRSGRSPRLTGLQDRIHIRPNHDDLFVPPPLERTMRVARNVGRTSDEWLRAPPADPQATGRIDHMRVDALAALSGTDMGTLRAGTIRADAIEPRFTINTDGITVNDRDGNRRFQVGNNGNMMAQGFTAGQGTWQASSGIVGQVHTEASYLERELVKFFKEKVTLNVSLSQLSAGLEVKVSLNLVDSGEELLSAEDFVKLD